jgi:hypothetical protein
MTGLVLKRASSSRPSGQWNDDDFDVLAEGAVVGRIFKANAAPVGSPWMWTLAFGHHEDRTPTHGWAATREGAMAAFAKRAGGGSDTMWATNAWGARSTTERTANGRLTAPAGPDASRCATRKGSSPSSTE